MNDMIYTRVVDMVVDRVRGCVSLESMFMVMMTLQLYVDEWVQLKINKCG